MRSIYYRTNASLFISNRLFPIKYWFESPLLADVFVLFYYKLFNFLKPTCRRLNFERAKNDESSVLWSATNTDCLDTFWKRLHPPAALCKLRLCFLIEWLCFKISPNVVKRQNRGNFTLSDRRGCPAELWEVQLLRSASRHRDVEISSLSRLMSQFVTKQKKLQLPRC